MLKKIFIFCLFFFLNISFVLAEIGPYCNNKISENLVKTIDNTEPKIIEVTLNNYRKWQKNNIRIITENARIIPLKYKKRFNAKIDVTFDGDLKCSFNARIRQHGDFKDHIYLKDGFIIQSLDVHLKTGHINGVTKFKLLIPHTRGKADHEIFLTELLREFDFLAPRTSYVEVKINERKTIMLFQEKAAKELLENSLRREGPIFEGDERYIYPALVKFPDNQLSNMAIGMLPEIEKGVAVQLAKQTNTKWTSKTNNHSQISYHSLTLLNRAFLLYSNQFNSSKNNFYYFNYNLDNNLLGLDDAEHILKLDIFNSIIFAANGWHGMVPTNRKFYWNSLENYFEPIYYDGNVNIDEDPLYINLPYSDYLLEAIVEAEKMLGQVQIDSFVKKLNFRGLHYDKIKIEGTLDKLKANLKKLTFKISSTDDDLISDNKNIKITDEMWSNYINLILNYNSKTNLILKNPNNDYFKVCNGKPLVCSPKQFSNSEIENLLESRLNLNTFPYQYIGEYFGVDFLNKVSQSNYKKVKIKDSVFYFDKDIEFEFDENAKIFNIYQKEWESRAFFYGGNLSNLSINFFGIENDGKGNFKSYPFDKRGLTGCLSFINLNVSKIKINSSNSNCEDSINLINVKGSIKKIDSKDTYGDAIDIDFSNVEIENVNINKAGNDCMDLSGGQYKLGQLSLSDCGDKGLSVGEKSSVTLENIEVIKSNIGLSSKDSSVVFIKNANIQETEICFEAKRKKQEFSGGIINLNNFDCNDSTIFKQAGSFINYN